jgi:hypothetical protein
LKYESITRIIDASEGLFRLFSPLKEQSEELSRKILCLAQEPEEAMESGRAEDLIIEINKFNMATRSYKSKKKIKSYHRCHKRERCWEAESECHPEESAGAQPIVPEVEHHSEDENEDFTYAVLSKTSTGVDFPLEIGSKLKDYE